MPASSPLFLGTRRLRLVQTLFLAPSLSGGTAVIWAKTFYSFAQWANILLSSAMDQAFLGSVDIEVDKLSATELRF